MADVMTDMMIDVETTGTSSPNHNGIFQIAALEFNYNTGAIGRGFDRCVNLLPYRFWDEDTKEFWQVKHRDLYLKLVDRMEPYPLVWGDFVKFVLAGDVPYGGYRFWCKPLSFDWPLVNSHILQLGGIMPFHYRNGRDLNSFMSALAGKAETLNMENVVFNKGEAHNALHDCAYQIDMLMAAKAGNFSEIVQ